MIEDGCPTPNLSILIWWMMSYNMCDFTEQDLSHILWIVAGMCRSSAVWKKDKLPPREFTFQDIQCYDSLVCSVWMRTLYGGMDSDMKLLKSCVEWCIKHSKEVSDELLEEKIDYPQELIVEITPEAIDFHPYPKILRDLSKRLLISKDTIRSYLWNTQSGYNTRKPYTHHNRVQWLAKFGSEIEHINQAIDQRRSELMNIQIEEIPL